MRRSSGHGRRGAGALMLVGFVGALLGACTGAPILANAPVSRPVAPVTTPRPSQPADPQPITFPADDAPHDRLTEWWYYTGHLRDTTTGDRYGFEFVVFRAERGDFPVTWASHFAITDEHGNRFLYAQRAEVGATVDRSTPGGGFDLAVAPGGVNAAAATAPPGQTWTMSGANGTDQLDVGLTPAEALFAGSGGALGLSLRLATTKPPALHDTDGFIDFGGAGGSYYYSRTNMTATGSVTLDGRTLAVDGEAWFDHQWGDFIAVGGGGWDWFAANLADGTDLTLSLVRDPGGAPALVYGTLVAPDGTTTHLPSDAFAVAVTGHWTSPKTGATYPAGWHVTIPGSGLVIDLTPAVAAQELDTRATTGVVYWEGSQVVKASRNGAAVAGEAYVELTGYASSVATPSPSPAASPAATPVASPGASPSAASSAP
jgi:predicted secreted hydrolase